MRTLLGLIHPTAGTATLWGKSAAKNPEVLRDVGYLPSEVFYDDGMKVIDLLKYSASFYRKDCLPRIRELADLLDLDLKRRIDDLSFGNRKKVGIVQGLLHEPKLILLDEPTAGLDPLMQQTFFELIAAENKKGATVLLSSHILAEVQKMCERVALIKDGSIIQLEKISTLQSNTVKRVVAVFQGAANTAIATMAGVSSWKIAGSEATFLYRGDVNLLLGALTQVPLANLSVVEPDLEEIFLHYYTPGATATGAKS
ncbi:MAG: ABC transporter ATP-binding protein [Spirochaetales bacterium]